MPEQNINAEQLREFVQQTAKEVARQKAPTVRDAMATEANYEQFITDVALIVSNAVTDFIITRQMTNEDLAAYNTKRLDELGDFIKQKLAELPPISPATE